MLMLIPAVTLTQETPSGDEFVEFGSVANVEAVYNNASDILGDIMIGQNTFDSIAHIFDEVNLMMIGVDNYDSDDLKLNNGLIMNDMKTS